LEKIYEGDVTYTMPLGNGVKTTENERYEVTIGTHGNKVVVQV
jgi:hypothetical protein